MRKAATVALALAVTAGAVLGVLRTGFFAKAVWVFQTSSMTEPDRGAGGPQVRPGSADGAAGSPVPSNGGFGERRRGPGRGNGGDGQRPGGEGAPGSGVNMANVGYFALIMAFFAMGTHFMDRVSKRRKAPRNRDSFSQGTAAQA